MATKYWMISNRSVDGNRLSGDPGKTHYWISDSEELDQLGKATLAEHELDDPFGSTLVKDIAACRKRLGKAGGLHHRRSRGHESGGGSEVRARERDSRHSIGRQREIRPL